MQYRRERTDIAKLQHRLYETKLTTSCGGNVNYTTDRGLVLITSSGIDKTDVDPRHVAVLDLDGRYLTPALKPSIETATHLAICRRSKGTRAIVHAHPPLATFFTISYKKINYSLLTESRILVGQPVLIPFRAERQTWEMRSRMRARGQACPCWQITESPRSVIR